MLLSFIKIAIIVPWTIILSIGTLLAIPLDRSGNYFRAVPRVWSRGILRICGVDVRLRGVENLEKGQAYVYVSNHASMFDIPAVLSSIPDEVNLVFKKELTWIPLWGWALRFGHFIMIDRTNARDAMQSLDRAAAQIHDGASVLLFAEGTRTRDGKLLPFKRGAFTLAAKSARPIIPVTLNNTFLIMPKGSLNIRPTEIEVVLDPPIPTEGKEGKAGEQQLMEAVHAAISKQYRDQS
jgi:1-acyl-sn-glycerol-3-phosphate acyltransferase